MIKSVILGHSHQDSLFFLCVVINRASRSGAAVKDFTVVEWRISFKTYFKVHFNINFIRIILKGVYGLRYSAVEFGGLELLTPCRW